MITVLAVGTGLLGLLIGSFVNVVAHRVPAGASIVRPRSSCPACGHTIRPRDNLPVLSWFLLGGRCRDCGASISLRYPLVEGVTALLFAATVVVVGVRWVLPAYLWFAGVTLVLLLTDLDHQRIPNRILYPGATVATVLLAFGALGDGATTAFFRAVAGGALYFTVLFLVALAARGGFGFGDVKLAFLLGEFLAYRSWGVLWAGVFLAVFIGGLAALALLLTRRKGRKEAIPFGPALVLGAWLAIPFGETLLRWYLG
jgi:leader peptidase (prepilin peptidase)/N-methyltransferase